MALPATICRTRGYFGGEITFSGLLVYEVSPERGFRKLGGIVHPGQADCNRWWTDPDSVVQRSLFFHDLVYSVASDHLKVQSLSDLGRDVAHLAFTP